jgi:hypothetical protein
MRFVCFTLAAALLMAAQDSSLLSYTKDGKLTFPENYREWIWLSSGLGMSYSPKSGADDNPSFDNVFVSPSAYRSFMATGKWPDRTVFVLEVRSSVNKGSINQSGHYQGKLEDVEVHVKDSRLKGGWGFFGFEDDHKPAAEIAHSASCYSCHERSGAVDSTFVQFYPTLCKVAQEKKTISPNWTDEQK